MTKLLFDLAGWILGLIIAVNVIKMAFGLSGDLFNFVQDGLRETLNEKLDALKKRKEERKRRLLEEQEKEINEEESDDEEEED